MTISPLTFTPLLRRRPDQLAALIENIAGTSSYNENIMNIINEETAALFAGQRTAEQVADVIQNRVSTYVAEQS